MTCQHGFNKTSCNICHIEGALRFLLKLRDVPHSARTHMREALRIIKSSGIVKEKPAHARDNDRTDH